MKTKRITWIPVPHLVELLCKLDEKDMIAIGKGVLKVYKTVEGGGAASCEGYIDLANKIVVTDQEIGEVITDHRVYDND